MALFSLEEKRRVQQLAAECGLNANALGDESPGWQKIGHAMGRDWREVRDAFRRWNMEAPEDLVQIQAGGAQGLKEEEVAPREIDDVQYYSLNILQCENNQQNNFQDEVCYAIEESVRVDQYTENSSFVNLENNDVVVNRKRSPEEDLNDFNDNLLRVFSNQTNEELEMKREEHQQKMIMLKIQIEQCKETHKEKMKILKAKLRETEARVYHIDHVICNKSLKKKFKSGPI